MILDETKLFDFVKIMFTKHKEYDQIKQFNKKRHHFMINRFFSIKYPANAQMFNINGIDGAGVVDSWSLVARQFKSVPGWFYTKTKKVEATKNKKEYIPSDRALEIYMQMHEVGKREVDEMKQFFPTEFYATLEKIDEQIKVY
jgi:hypothetical protein